MQIIAIICGIGTDFFYNQQTGILSCEVQGYIQRSYSAWYDIQPYVNEQQVYITQ